MKDSLHSHKHTKIEDCSHCKDRIPFEFPQEIIQACIEDKLVIFAGAGISSESKKVFPFTLYEDIQSELKIKENLDFPSLMDRYCSLPNGKTKLLQKIRKRLQYIDSFPELYRKATEFHRELSTIYFINEIITTNWDDYFEKECNALPIVTPEDFAFWDNPGRKVFKIHGSINNIGSIISTTKEYKKSFKSLNKGIIGSKLKLLLATKVVVFVGYSFSDFDFNKIFNFIKNELKDILPHIYIVTLNIKTKEKLKKINSTLINTDATYFISELKSKLIQKKLLLPDEIYNEVIEKLMEVTDIHFNFSSKLNFKEKPETIYLASYQDGLIHAFERIIQLKNTGHYSHDCNSKSIINAYDQLKKDKLKNKKYFDVAYIEGYINGHLFLLVDNKVRKNIPMYFIFGNKIDLNNKSDYLRESKKANTLHKESYHRAQNYVKKYKSADLVIHHTPFLL